MDSHSKEEQIRNILNKVYNLRIKEVDSIVGYTNLNYKVVDEAGNKYIVKEHPSTLENIELYTAESQVLDDLAAKYPQHFQKPVKTARGDYLSISKRESLLYRVLGWLEGDFLNEVDHNPELFYSFGAFLAKMDKELMMIEPPVIKARQIDWDLQNILNLRQKIRFISNPSIRKLLDYYFIQIKEFLFPEIPELRKSIIHNDGNDWNVLVKNDRVCGIIDFGDMVYAPLIQELAVATTYAMFDKEDPLKWSGYIISAYHKIIPLNEKELELLYYLIAARLCVSLILSAEGASENPDNEYIQVSQKPALELLRKWITISPDRAAKVFKKAAGFKVVDNSDIHKDLRNRHRFVGRALSVSYSKPIKMKRAAFQYMFDAEGNTFLDAYNNIPHVGHQHPRVVEAGQKQMAILNTNTRYLYDQLAEYAEKLLCKFPDPLNKVFFVNSGSAASDLAVRMAQTHTNNQNLVVMEHGYHGHTHLGLDISHYKFGGKGGAGQKPNIFKAPIPDTYKGEFTTDDAGIQYAHQLNESIIYESKQIAAFIAEPIVGCGGQVPLVDGYLKEVYPMIRKRGGVCISDEVQTGFGRIGTHFWGFEAQGVIPDIVVLGKPMGNGHPIGAVVTTDEIAESFDNGMEFFSSFGGNPVSCAIGMAVLDVIEEEGLQQSALEVGNHFISLLSNLQKEIQVIGDIRGSGLFLGVEFVKDPKTKEPNTSLAQFLKNKLRENCILVSTDGPYDNVIKMKPPMCFNKQNADKVLEEIKRILSG